MMLRRKSVSETVMSVWLERFALEYFQERFRLFIEEFSLPYAGVYCEINEKIKF